MLDMDQLSSPPDSPGATPLQPLSADQVNQRRDSIMSASLRSENHRDSSVFEKINQFNNLSHPFNAAAMTKQLERKTADAALKRAMVGREEAEGEMRKYREEVRLLRKQVEDGKERERKVGERLETVMENYGRAKETHAHTQALWEKEIRRARKEAFKSQSSIVKLQEELKATRTQSKSSEEDIEREKERSKVREQEAFSARYQLVGVQEQLEQALERIKVIEQERDAFKSLAKEEEIARIAAEGRIPLPPLDKDDEFASPQKSRESFSTTDVVSSAASEAEIEDLTRLWQWEKQRADRTQEHLEFLEAECQLCICHAAKMQPRLSIVTSPPKERRAPISIVDPADRLMLGEQLASEVSEEQQSPVQEFHVEEMAADEAPIKELPKEARRSTIFLPQEGYFRTVSQQEAEALEAQAAAEAAAEADTESASEDPTPTEPTFNPVHYARTPSVEPPAFALMGQKRTSLLSLLNAPRQSEVPGPVMNIPTTPGNADIEEPEPEIEAEEETTSSPERPDPEVGLRPHTSAAFYTVTTTTTVPVREKTVSVSNAKRSTGGTRTPSFDINNPALTPTMTREQALAQIKERRGRARSAAQGAMTPRKQMVTGTTGRRDASAPAGRAAKGRT